MRLTWLCALAALPLCAAGRAQTPPRPNVLFLLADDQRPDALGAAGNPHIRTPNLDRLAARGFRFTQNYCMGSIHGAVCQPSRAMLLSGRTLYRVPMQLQDTPTLPELLGAQGYTTFGTGKWHNGEESFLRSFQSGKSVMIGGMSNHAKVPIRDVTPEHALSPKRTGDGFSSELFADAAVEFLEQHDGSAPFFCYVAFTAPHDPRQPPEAYREAYYAAPPPLPANFLPQHPFHNGWMRGRDEKLAPWPRTEEVIRDQLSEYYGLVTHLDAQVGRILAALERGGFGDNTVVVYTADHGLAVGSHGLLGKQSVYEHSMGCPLVVAGPGVPRGESAALTYLYDLMPTVCELTSSVTPEGVEGHSLAPLWRGEADRVRETLFLTYEDLMRAVRDDRYKLIRYPRIDHEQLFDLAADPDEMHDLIGDPTLAETADRLRAEMRAWQAAVADPHPLVVERPEPKEIDLTGTPRKPDRWQPDWIVKKYFGDER